MSTILISRTAYPLLTEALRSWWPLAAGMLVLYIPTFYSLATGIWSTEAYAHGPVILALSLWLIARQWGAMLAASQGKSGTLAGWPVFVLGLLMYIVGRSQSLPILEIGSFVLLLGAVILIVKGGAALKLQWFPFFFMLFMIPLPGTVVNLLTLPMKEAVSFVTEHLLFWAGYPITRSGVILQMGQYELLVADACAGLQTLLTLEALGLFYLNIVKRNSAFRNAVLGLLIVPISFFANVTRVIVLTLITYHFGDRAGQGFLHGFAGMLLFLSALLLIVSVDWMLQVIVQGVTKRKHGRTRHE